MNHGRIGMRMVALLVLGAVVALLMEPTGALMADARAETPTQVFNRSPLAIQTRDGRRIDFVVEMALTPAQQEQGLMFRQALADNAGMLFINPVERPVAFWMRNTLIPLDMLFADAAGQILRIHERAVPGDLTPIPSNYPVLGVLEIMGGGAQRMSIRVGDRIVHPAFRPR